MSAKSSVASSSVTRLAIVPVRVEAKGKDETVETSKKSPKEQFALNPILTGSAMFPKLFSQRNFDQARTVALLPHELR